MYSATFTLTRHIDDIMRVVSKASELDLKQTWWEGTDFKSPSFPNQLGIVVTFFVNLIAQLKMASLMSLTHLQRNIKLLTFVGKSFSPLIYGKGFWSRLKYLVQYKSVPSFLQH